MPAYEPEPHAVQFASHFCDLCPINDGMDIHALAIQMGTSIGMIERHYSHLTPRLKKDMLTGKRYELSRDEWLVTDGKGS